MCTINSFILGLIIFLFLSLFSAHVAGTKADGKIYYLISFCFYSVHGLTMHDIFHTLATAAVVRVRVLKPGETLRILLVEKSSHNIRNRPSSKGFDNGFSKRVTLRFLEVVLPLWRK